MYVGVSDADYWDLAGEVARICIDISSHILRYLIIVPPAYKYARAF